MAKRTEEQLLNDIVKPQAIEYLRASCDKDFQVLSQGYPERETSTWAFQLEESRQYLKDSTYPTPFISAALREGESIEDYANLIVANNDAWSVYAGSIVNKRREYTARIQGATTRDEVKAIVEELEAS